MIAGYAICGSQERTMEVFEEMRLAGEKPDEVTMLSLTSACADSGAIEIGMRLHSSLNSGVNMHLENALIDICMQSVGAFREQWKCFRG